MNGYTCFALFVIFIGCASADVQAMRRKPPEEPRWMKFSISEANFLLELEGENEKRTIKRSNLVTTRERLFIAPTMEMKLKGSIYHPNLLLFNAQIQIGLVREDVTLGDPTGSGNNLVRDELEFLQRFSVNLSVLKEKPYSVELFGQKADTFRDYDFFTRVEVDQLRYGFRAGFSKGPMPFSISMSRLTEEETGSPRPQSRDEDTLSFTAKLHRKTGSRTDLYYSLTNFTRRNIGNPLDDGFQQTARFSDTTKFGDKNAIKLHTFLRYHQLEANLISTESMTAQQRLSIIHSENLDSDYYYNFSIRNSGPVKSDSHQVSASLKHRLYEALTSTLDVKATEDKASGPSSNTNIRRFGLGLNEHYTRRVGDTGRLTLRYNIGFTREQREATGPLIFVVDEEKRLKDNMITFLNLSRVNTASVRVTDAMGNIPYEEFFDYLIVGRGQQTEIRRVPGGRIKNGDEVLVSYGATLDPNDKFTTLSNSASFRLALFDDILSLYAQLRVVDNWGGESLVLQDINDKIVGGELSWRWLDARAEFESFDSNLSPFRSLRLSQSLHVEPSKFSTLTLDLSQRWSTFPAEGRQNEVSYNYIGRYQTKLTRYLSLRVEGGMRIEKGQNLDQQLVTVRTDLEFRLGRLAVEAGYVYQDEDFFDDLFRKHFFFLRGRRTF